MQNKRPTFHAFSTLLDEKAREQGIPIYGQFELTPLCNFDCKMCYVHLNPDQISSAPPLSVEVWKHLMHEAWSCGMITATLTGGECLTYPGFEEIYLYLHSLGCEVKVLTNASLLDEHWIRFFSEHPPAALQITLYGDSEDVYERVTGKRCFDTVLCNVRKVIEAGLPVKLNITPSRYLGDDALGTYKLAKSLTDAVQINSVLFSPREETGRNDQQDDLDTDGYIALRRSIKEFDGEEIREISPDLLPPAGSVKGSSGEEPKSGLACGGGRSSFMIDWKGKLYPCTRLSAISADPLKDGFEAAWKKINHEANMWPKVQECEECAYKTVCLKCAANMLRYAPPGVRPAALCEETKRYVQKGIMPIPNCE